MNKGERKPEEGRKTDRDRGEKEEGEDEGEGKDE